MSLKVGARQEWRDCEALLCSTHLQTGEGMEMAEGRAQHNRALLEEQVPVLMGDHRHGGNCSCGAADGHW